MEHLTQWWVCAKCRHEHSRQLSPEIAAFVQRNQWDTTCPKCGGSKYASVSFPRPSLTEPLLDEWSSNHDLSFSDQDEDLLLATAEDVPLLSHFVKRCDIPEQKRATLLSALCVIVYENTFDPSDPNAAIDTKLADRVIQFLKDNIQLFDEIDTDYLYEYIMEDVYPQLGLNRDAST